MKTITIVAAMLLCFGCATPPTPPNSTQMVLDILDHKEVDVKKVYADYNKARAEYEQTASYKSIPYLLAPLLILGGAAKGCPLVLPVLDMGCTAQVVVHDKMVSLNRRGLRGGSGLFLLNL